MKKKLSILLITLVSFLGFNSAFSVPNVNPEEHAFQITPNELQWQSNPALPKEIQVSVVYGDPSKDGPVVLRLKVPAGTKIAPHWHPIAENITVLSGSIHLGFGDTLDETKGTALPAGSFASLPAKHHHYAWVTEDSVIQLNNFGKWEIIYVNPKDDPRNQ